jgi:hypothetical protein
MTRRGRGIVVGVLAAVLLGVATIAVAAQTGPKTDSVAATFTGTRTDAKMRECNSRERFEGTSTGDLAGDVVLKTRSLVNQDTGLGTTSGHFKVRETGSGKVLAVGKLDAVNTNGGQLDGFLKAHMTGPGKGRLWANFRATVDANGAVTAEIGGGESANSAVVQSGRCSGGNGHGKGDDKEHGKGHGRGHDNDHGKGHDKDHGRGHDKDD